jgi:hypothetical protein
MSTARDRHQTSGWLRRQIRRPAILGTGLAATAALLSGGATVLAAGPASADTTTSTQSFTEAGVYYVTVPQNVTAFSLAGLGGAGEDGQPASDNVSTGGAGGSGSSVTESFAGASNIVLPGDVLQFVVGAGGGGADGGTGDGIAGNGGNGGGVTYIYDQTTSTYFLVAAGGGGGGGGSGLFPGYNGGNGGTDGPGGAGIGQYGGYIGAGGSEGPNCFSSSTSPDEGGTGQKAPTASADGGGGGGGGGICGGSGGKADVGSGGGGGGSGYSVWAGYASSHSLTSGSNTGDGSASVTFTVTTQAPAITSASCMYATSDGSGHFTAGHVTATGIPAPTLSLVNPPSWLGLGNQVITYSPSGAPTTSAALQDRGTVADGQYTVPVEATNSVSSTIEPLSLAIEPGSAPAFVSGSAATATAGTPFDFAVRTASCPAINDYTLQGVDTATSSWLRIDSETGELSGTPTAAAAGTHTFTINAAATGSDVSINQSFTLTVKGPAATAPGAPVIGTATAGNAQATVSFSPPASDGGAAITSYTVTAKDATSVANGGQTASSTGSPVTVTGLTNGDSYTFTVTATNSAGTGPASDASNAVTPAAPVSAPGAPVIGAATGGNAQATVNFTPPASNGGAAITRYTVTAADQTSSARGGQTATGTGSPVTVSGLTNGDSYTFTVTATNTAGTGPASAASNAVTPEPPGKPSADLSVTLSPHATAADGSAFTETVTVTNHGPWAATGVRTVVTVPGQLTVTADPGGTKTGPVVSWTDASLGANQSVTYTITFAVAAKARGTVLIAAATAAPKVADPKPLNNAAIIAVKLG